MMSLVGGMIRCVVLLYGLGKAGRVPMSEEPLRVILSLSQKKYH